MDSTNENISSLPLGPQQIAVLDGGWIFVGQTEIKEDWIIIRNARCIRHWGTSKGLGQLIDGPTDSSVLDHYGVVVAPRRALKFFIPCTKMW